MRPVTSLRYSTVSQSTLRHRLWRTAVLLLPSPAIATHSWRHGLTRRSSGAPTAGHQRPAGGTRYIFASRAPAARCCRPLSSNVRPCIQPTSRFANASQSSLVEPAMTSASGLRSSNSFNCSSCAAARFGLASSASTLDGFRGPKRAASAVLAHSGEARACGQSNPTVAARPNPSFNRTRYGRPPWPGRRYALHFRQPGQGVLPQHAG